MRKLLLAAAAVSAALSGRAEEFRITPDHTAALQAAEAGDVVIIGRGRYVRPIELKGLAGTVTRPVLLRAEEGAVFDGTDCLDGRWTEVTPDTKEGRRIQPAQWKRMKGRLYCRKVKKPVYALVYKGRLMSNARWPDSRWDDPWRLDRYYVLRRADTGSVKGRIQDGLATEDALKESSAWLHYDRSQCHQREETLGGTGLSFKDAVLVLSHAWGSWATRVTGHEAGEDFLTYDTTFAGSGSLRKEADTFLNRRLGWDKGKSRFSRSSGAGIHFFLMGLPALDLPEEWWYDSESGLLFFLPPDGRMPEKGEVQGKRRDYQLKMQDCAYVRVEGVDFYGAALEMKDCTHCTIADADFRFSASEKFGAGDFDMPATVSITNRKKQGNAGNVLTNCTFSYLDGNAFEARSAGMVIDNVLIYRTQQTTLGLSSHTLLLEKPALVRRVTIEDVGASTGIRGGGSDCIYELNDISRFGGLQYDGSAIQSGGRNAVIYRYNWSHDHPKRSFRFDAGQYPPVSNAFGEISYNVAWNTPGGISVKGDDHLLHNNLCMDGGFVLFNMKRWASKNERTLAANNLVPSISAGIDDWKEDGVRKNNRTGEYENVRDDYWLKETPAPEGTPSFVGRGKTDSADGGRAAAKASPILAVLKRNCYEDPHARLRDPDNLDFRLREDSGLQHAGYRISPQDVPWKRGMITGSEKWKNAPDIGPYGADETHYWIPGFQRRQASRPVPVNGTTTAKTDCDLMWLEGYASSGHIVYFSDSEKEVREADRTSPCKLAELKAGRNIVRPGGKGIRLEGGKKYFWRVDVLRPEGVVKGEVWNFTPASGSGTDPGVEARAGGPPAIRKDTVSDAAAEAGSGADRLAWWREARFGMFIHYGLYSQCAGYWDGKAVPGIGEWIFRLARIPVADYHRLAETFSCNALNPKEWVRLAKDAGMKYIVITAKHHDGFALFKSEADKFNVVDATPYGKDLIRQVTDACHECGMKVGLYYSQFQDWSRPGAGGNDWEEGYGYTPEGFEKYMEEKALPQVRELLTNYGKIDMIWFDTPGRMSREQSGRFLRLARELQPDIIVSGRVGNELGDYVQMEDNNLPFTRPDRDWEVPVTMNHTWGYKKDDHDWKSVSEILRQLTRSAAMGGNYLLNIGPEGDGSVPQESLERMAEIGEWMHAHGETVCHTEPSPFPAAFRWGGVTVRGDNLFLNVSDPPSDGKIILYGLHNEVKKAYFLLTGAEVPCRRERGYLILDLSGQPLEKYVSTLVLELDGKPEAEQTFVQDYDGSVILEAGSAENTTGRRVRFGSLNKWFSPEGKLAWNFLINRPGRFRVEVITTGYKQMAYPDRPALWDGGHEVLVEVAGRKISGTLRRDRVEPAPDDLYNDFKVSEIGEVEIDREGRCRLELTPLKIVSDHKAGLAVRQIRLIRL